MVAVLIAAVALVVCGWLGVWQWQRAQQQAQVVDPGPTVALREVMVPGDSAMGIGRSVTATGTWGQAPVVLVTGREVEGQAATLLLVPFTVAADATGTGGEATLAVLAGWLPADAVTSEAIPTHPASPSAVTLTGHLRGAEPVAALESADGVLTSEAMSTAALAAVWPAPLYSVILTADEPVPGWRAFPQPEPETRLDLRSATYAAEWWLFGAFAVFICARWIRDNGRGPSATQAPDGGGDVRD